MFDARIEHSIALLDTVDCDNTKLSTKSMWAKPNERNCKTQPNSFILTRCTHKQWNTHDSTLCTHKHGHKILNY